MDLPDPLLPFPDGEIELAPDLTGEERLHAAFVAAIDHVNLHAMAWPAQDKQGRLVPPPAEHVLHELAHAYDLADEERLMVNPRVGTVAVIDELPECNVCGTAAHYDAHITIGDRSGGANLCDVHYLELGSGSLGATGDTYLMRKAEVPVSVRQTCNQIREAQGKDHLF
jgi:hypothetical protein